MNFTESGGLVKTLKCPLCGGIYTQEGLQASQAPKDGLTLLQNILESNAKGSTSVEYKLCSEPSHNLDGQRLKFYCQNHHVLVCMFCTQTKHETCECKSLAELAATQRLQIKESAEKSLKTMEACEKSLDMYEQCRIQSIADKKKIQQEINRRANEAIHKINGLRKNMLETVNNVFTADEIATESKQTSLDITRATIQRISEMGESFANHCSDTQVVEHSKLVDKKLQILQTLNVPLPTTILDVGLISLDATADFARLQTSRKGLQEIPNKEKRISEGARTIKQFSTSLKYDIKTCFLRGCTINENDDIFIVDKDNRKVKIFNINGQFKKSFDTPGKDPYDVAIQPTNRNILITDLIDHDIKVCNPNGVFIEAYGKEYLREPKGIDVSLDGRIFVLDSFPKHIYVHDSDYELLTSIILVSEIFKTPAYFALSKVNHNIIVSDWENHVAGIINKEGNLVVQHGSKGCADRQFRVAAGICTDHYGHIFIADSGNSRIHVLYPDGRFMQNYQLPVEIKPRSVAITNKGLLVVVGVSGTITILRYQE